MKKQLLICALVAGGHLVNAQHTETKYLTGKGLNDTVEWDFYCTNGMNSKVWSKIGVPSQWELQGFGEYTYGRWYKISDDTKPSMEEGYYHRTFTIPADWKDKSVRIVFQGVMTDTEVKINGKIAGEIHQGGFYEFGYDITDKLILGKENKIEVKVSKHSSNNSVNASERKADWWTFGGIYRPVFLEAKPKQHIERMALDCRADGSIRGMLNTTDLQGIHSLQMELLPLTGKGKFGKKEIKLGQGKEHAIDATWSGVDIWNSETPNLYTLKLSLKDGKGKIIHTQEQRVGFRTVEFKKKDGLYVNGTKVVLKGINRHSFHPDGGRTTNRDISLEDVKLIKEMNMNAVRFHYAPDKHFLDLCDSLGLYTMNELCGWQNGYDKNIAPKLLEELIARDVNHPSILVWSNGNEGGWSSSVDHLFRKFDPQQRQVIHAWADYDGLDTHHYPAYQTGIARLQNGYNVFMPTEFMHGSWDQGHGAGLEDFWNMYTDHPLFAGAFMWDFSDNAVKRVDMDGILDSDGSNAPDGILGPYREKEGSYYTVRDIWAPIQFKKLYITPSFNGEFLISNTYLYTNLKQCKMEYRVLQTPSPLQKGKEAAVVAQGAVTLPTLSPGETGKMKLNLPTNFWDGDVLEMTAYHPNGDAMCTWTWPVRYAQDYFARQYSNPTEGDTQFAIEGEQVILKGNQVSVAFDKNTGMISAASNQGKKISFNNGPIAVGMKATYKTFKAYKENGDAVFVAKYDGGIDSIEWRMKPDGMMKMSAVLLNKASGGGGFDDSFSSENITNLGITFSYPEDQVEGVTWMGKGPYRVWKNRQRGTNYNIWGKEYNNTMTGCSFENLIYPEFKGYHANMYWLTLENKEQPFSFYSESDGLFVHLFTPEEPTNRTTNQRSMPVFPTGDISFLYEIPAIRCFKPVAHHGPKSQPGSVRIKSGDEGIQLRVWFDFSGKNN